MTPTPELLLPVKHLIDNLDRHYPLNFTQAVEFMDESTGERDTLNLVYKYTNDVQGVCSMLSDIVPLLTHGSIRNRRKRVCKLLKKAYGKFLTENARGKPQRKSIVHARGNQRKSQEIKKGIRGNQRKSQEITGNHRKSKEIKGNQKEIKRKSRGNQ